MEKKIAIAGTGYRAVTMFGRMLAKYGSEHRARIVALYDPNPVRMQAAQRLMNTEAALYDDFDRMLRESGCNTVLVTTVDRFHDEYIVRALKAGYDVVTEKPLTTDAEKLTRILQAERDSGHRVTVTFNYRYAPYATAIKEFLASGRLGRIATVQFEWYLDTVHGADYFRRWHRKVANSGSLWVHKATHHFDLVNWWLNQEPEEVFARASRQVYGDQGGVRGERCSTCSVKDACAFAFDWSDPVLVALYREAEHVDGYWRDGCVFSDQIDIWDTMTGSVAYSGGTVMNYALHAYTPFEGYRAIFTGTQGRLECGVLETVIPEGTTTFLERVQHRVSPDAAPATFPLASDGTDRFVFYPVFGGAEVIEVPRTIEGHGGGDERMVLHWLDADAPDPLSHRAGTRAGAYSILTGIAARESVAARRPVSIGSLVDLSLLN
ncbi:MAG: Gfo/Idh/MocA family oxidoreductase [Firmicutes bacterium]|nr:Gfo/Idh/MocA family oxidoreductase [Bacillota bacterium]